MYSYVISISGLYCIVLFEDRRTTSNLVALPPLFHSYFFLLVLYFLVLFLFLNLFNKTIDLRLDIAGY